MYHTEIVDQLTRQRDHATAECKETIKELNLMTQELKSLADVMKDQTDTIDRFLETITCQKATIEELEARVAALEKPDPDLSIYELSDSESEDESASICSDSCSHDEVPPEFETINKWIAVLLGLSVFYVALTCTDPKYLRLSDEGLY